MHPIVPLLLPVVVLPACAGTPGADTPAPEGPVIERLVPDRGPAGEAYPVRVVIEGSGFARRANTVRFGPIVLPDLPSEAGGTRITLFAPKMMPATGEVSPAPLLPGTYEISVETPVGRSAPATFTLEPAG